MSYSNSSARKIHSCPTVTLVQVRYNVSYSDSCKSKEQKIPSYPIVGNFKDSFMIYINISAGKNHSCSAGTLVQTKLFYTLSSA